MDLQDLMESTSTVTAEYKGLTFKLEVFTEKLTPKYKAKAIALASRAQAEVEAAEEAGTNPDAEPEVKDETAMMLADLLSTWRDKDDQPITMKGEAFEPTFDNLVGLSYPLLTVLLREVTTYLGGLANPQSAQN